MRVGVATGRDRAEIIALFLRESCGDYPCFLRRQDTASRDIADLVERRILTKDTAGGRSTSYSLGDVE